MRGARHACCQMLLRQLAGASGRFRQRGQRLLKKIPNLGVRRGLRENLMSRKNPPGVSIYHKDGMIAGVEQDRIRSLRADAMQSEKFLPKLLRGTREQLCQKATIAGVQKCNE